MGFEWHRPSGAANELWDLLIYANAGLDMLALEYSRQILKLEFVNWVAFWDACESQKLYFEG